MCLQRLAPSLLANVSQCSPDRQAFFCDSAIEWSAIEELVEAVMHLPTQTSNVAKLGLGELNAYGFSKACVSLYSLLLARTNPALFINACTPGFIETDLTRPLAVSQGVDPADLGMKKPEEGTASILHLLFGESTGSGHYYGSDAKRSPLHCYRAPGSPEYTGS